MKDIADGIMAILDQPLLSLLSILREKDVRQS